MSNQQNDIYLESMEDKFVKIISEKRWDLVQPFYIELEENGFGNYVAPISHLMTDEDVREYKKWDEKVNGSMATQMDDDSDF